MRRFLSFTEMGDATKRLQEPEISTADLISAQQTVEKMLRENPDLLKMANDSYFEACNMLFKH